MSKSANYREYGFTLVELLCVITLLGIMASIAMPALQDMGRKRNLEIAARTMAVDIRRSQQTSIATGIPYCIEFILVENIYNYRIKNCLTSKTERITFPEGVEYRSTTFPAAGGNIAKLRFKPNGAPNFGGTVVLCNTDGDTLYVIVTPATGRVRISPDPPDHWDVHALK